ncbi:MAG TPA: 50S ribosomal protein L13 [Candidatus Thermoplasmatota archaeon]|nr:50S ribosomal protein L13 [Candidatus Thermoplasmatota archaeon]
MTTVIDAQGLILGRLATNVAKRLLEGEPIVIVNAEKAVISGSRENILERYRSSRRRGKIRKGPFYPRTPHMILKRTVRGMIPYQEPRGRAAYRRLTVHVGVPDEFAKTKPETLPSARKTALRGSVTLAHVARDLGSRVGVSP